MRTPIVPEVPGVSAPTIRLHHPVGEPSEIPSSERANLGSTPLPPRPGNDLPRIRGYEILSVIGTGGMGIVYEARHIELNRRVAIKMLRGQALADPEFRERFRAEAEAIARLQHPNVIQVFEVGTVELQIGELHPVPFLVLEFVDGGSLTQQTYSPQSPRDAARMVETLARAAHAAHRLGIVHRDLKPANVLLTRDGVPKIADFGIAKQIDSERPTERLSTRAGTVMGTPEYMAPEQHAGTTATPAFDIYALGVILYELLTGRVPFQGTTLADTLMLAASEDPEQPRRLQPAIPRDLETICLKCLEKDPRKRYDTAQALADDLARWSEGRVIQARAIGVAERTVRWAKRNPAVAALSLAVQFVAITGIAGILWQWNDARTNAINAQANAYRAVAEAEKANAAAEKERWERYRVSVFAASSALRLHDTNAARRALDAAPEKHRDWVWALLNAQLDRSQAVLGRETGLTSRGRFTPDGRWALLSDADGVIRVWDLIERKEYRPLGKERRVRNPHLSHDGSEIVYLNDTNDIFVSDSKTGRTRLTLCGHKEEIDWAEFSPDGTRIISSSPGQVRVWDARTAVQLHLFQAPKLATRPMQVSPDYRFAMSRWNGAETPRVWELETGREITRLHGHEGPVLGYRFSPNGMQILTWEGYPINTLRLWDTMTGQLLAVMRGHENQITWAEFNGDGTRVISGSMDRSVRVWDTTPVPGGGKKHPLHILRGHTGWVDHATFSPDGARVITSSYDRTLRYWNTETGELLAVLHGHTAQVLGGSLLVSNKTINSVAVDGTVRVWDLREVEDNYAIRGHKSFVYSVAFHPDGVRAASSAWDGTARIWNITERRELSTLPHPSIDMEGQIVAATAYHPSGQYLATLCRDTGLRLWDAQTSQELHRWKHFYRDWRDSRIAFSPKGDLIAAGGPSGRVRVWDVNTKAEVALFEKHTDAVRDVAFSPDGSLLASTGEAGDQTVRIWDVATKKAGPVLRGHQGCVYAIAWNPAAPLLASGSNDGTVRLWNTTTWEPVGIPFKQGTNVYAVAFHPDGKLLAVACADNLIRIWDVGNQQELAELSGHSDYVHSLSFSPDGTRLISASGDRSIRVWDTLTPAERARQKPTP